MSIPRRGPNDLAGIQCQFKTSTHSCDRYARYAVSGISGDKPDATLAVCGQHLPPVIRDVWRDQNSAVVIQEIPGMWR